METANTKVYEARLNGAAIQISKEEYETVLPKFVAENGGGLPEMIPLQSESTPAPVIEAGAMDHEGRLRSEADRELALVAGFAPQETVFARGSRVNEIGVSNARISREDWEKRPTMLDAATDFSALIAAERRKDVTAKASKLRMDANGMLVRGDGKKVAITPTAFRALVERMGLPRAAGYLSECWPELRAVNINRWAKMIGDAATSGNKRQMDEYPEKEFVLRTRVTAEGDPQVFAAVGKGYTPFDADLVVDALAVNIDTTARAEIVYDGRRVKATALFHSDVQPEKYVAGEFFKFGAILSSADDGTGSVKCSIVGFQNLCLNLIIIDEQEIEVARIIHAGDAAKINERVREAVRAARGKIAPFLQKWNLAVEDDLLKEIRASTPLLTVSEAIEGFFNGAIEKELVPLPKRNRETVLKGLAEAFDSDVSAASYRVSKTVTRAGLVNAFTRYAHTELGAFDGFELEKAASKLIRTSTVLPFVPAQG